MSLTPKQRSERARVAAQARWARAREDGGASLQIAVNERVDNITDLIKPSLRAVGYVARGAKKAGLEPPPVVPNARELKVITTYLETGSITRAGLAGFGGEHRRNAFRYANAVLKRWNVDGKMLADCQGLTLGAAVNAVSESLKARKVDRRSLTTYHPNPERAGHYLKTQVVQEFEDPDHAIRLKAAEITLKLHGQDSGERAPSADQEGASKELLRAMMETLDHIRANTARSLNSEPIIDVERTA